MSIISNPVRFVKSVLGVDGKLHAYVILKEETICGARVHNQEPNEIDLWVRNECSYCKEKR